MRADTKASMKPFELIEVQHLQVACDGGGGGLGHPKVFLQIDEEKGRIVCPYCSRTYVLRQSGRRKASSH